MEWDPNTPALWDWDDSAASAVAFPGPQEPPIGLKLGKRTYFEDVSAAAKNPASSSTSSSPSAAAAAAAGATGASIKKSRVSHQSAQIFRCQVEGCDLDLSAAKEYHRKHRVCENHSKCPCVVVGGQERRFCQQCSRFHDLSAFDEKKRSCRKRLADHNARRRKPQQATISFSSQGLSSQFYGDRQQMNLLFDRAPFGHMRPSSSSMWEASCDFKISHGDGSWTKPTKGDLEGHLLLPGTDLSSNVSSLRCDLDKLLPFKVTTAEVLSQGPEASVIASNLNGAPNLRRALSLLSTDSWVSAEPGSIALSQAAPTNQISAAHHVIRAVNATSHYWQDKQPIAQQARMIPFAMHNSGSHFQEFQLLKEPFEGTFFDSSQIH